MRPMTWPWKPPNAGRFISRKNPSIRKVCSNLVKRALEIRQPARRRLDGQRHFPVRGDEDRRAHRPPGRAQRCFHSDHRRKRHRQGSHRGPDPHLQPARPGPLIKINCAALPRELIESELFGCVKGAFTGAHSDREGLFRQAEGGTLLLDELSEMPIDTQSKLLRVLQEKEVRPVGGRTSYKTDCRIIAATNRKTEEAIRDGKLREDLFYRISAVSVHLPPLRERREDILPLANAFLKRFAAQANRDITGFSPRPRSACARSTGPAMCANCKTKSSARCCSARARSWTARTCPSLPPPARPTATPASPCWKVWSATPSSRCSRKPAATSSKPPNASASAARRSTTRSKPTASRL